MRHAKVEVRIDPDRQTRAMVKGRRATYLLDALLISEECGDWRAASLILTFGSAVIAGDADYKVRHDFEAFLGRMQTALAFEQVHGPGALLDLSHPLTIASHDFAKAKADHHSLVQVNC